MATLHLLPKALEKARGLPAPGQEREAAWLRVLGGYEPAEVRAAARLFPATAAETFRRWVEIRSPITPEDEREEPFLAASGGEPTRSALLPIRDPEIWEFRKKIQRLHWVAEEVDMSQDAGDFARADEGDRRLVEFILCFFSVADELVLQGLDEVITSLAGIKEEQHYLIAQAEQESVHSEAYSIQIQEIIPPERREAVFDAVRRLEPVRRMADWIRFWTQIWHPAADVYTAFAFVEGQMFSGFFAALQYYKTRNLFPGLTSFNEFIARDENIHGSHSSFVVVHRLRRGPAPDAVRAIADETVGVTADFFREAVPAPLAGINAELLAQYNRHIADAVLEWLNLPPKFGDPNPFPFMVILALNRRAKSNFFEHRPTQYQAVGNLQLGVAEAPPVPEEIR